MRVQLLVGSLRTWLGQKSQALRKIQVEGRESNISLPWIYALLSCQPGYDLSSFKSSPCSRQ